MQPYEVQFDLGSIPPHLTGMAKIFALYLLLMLIFALGRSVRLALQLWHLPRRKRTALMKSGSITDQAHLLACCALTNYKYSREFSRSASDAASDTPSQGEAGRVSPMLSQAADRFRYAWELCEVNVAAFKKLAKLTLLWSLLTILIEAAKILQKLPGEKASTMIWSSLGLLQVLTCGIFVSLALYGLWSLFEGVLHRRRAAWNYFCSSIRNESTK